MFTTTNVPLMSAGYRSLRHVCIWITLGLVLAPGCLQRGSHREIVWTCPPGESIAYIVTGRERHSLFILTQRGSEWVLRMTRGGTSAEELASGTGKAQPVNPVVLSPDGRHCLVGWAKAGGIDGDRRPRIYGASYCDVNRKGKIDIAGLENVLTYSLVNPFSPDGKWVALYASDQKHKGIWLVGLETGKARFIASPHITGNGRKFIAFTDRGEMAVYDAQSGMLFVGKPERLVYRGTCAPGASAYIAPDAGTVVVAAQSADELRLLRYYIPGKTGRTLYVDRSAEIGKANVLGFQHAGFNQDMTLNVLWPGVSPLYIHHSGGCSKVASDKYSPWRFTCGVAVWDDYRVAVVKPTTDKEPDTIVALTVGR